MKTRAFDTGVYPNYLAEAGIGDEEARAMVNKAFETIFFDEQENFCHHTDEDAWCMVDTGNIDCLPLGDLSGTLLSLMMTNPLKPDFLFEGKTPKGECTFDTREVRSALGSDIPLNEPEVAAWLQEALNEEINPILGGM